MIRPYRKDDFASCLELIRANTPPYFDPSEEADFAQFLGEAREPYFVLVKNGLILACAGYAFNKWGEAHLAWGMVKPDFHKQGYGSQLLRYRLNLLKDKTVLLDTSQHTYRFFEKFGFVTENITQDGYGPGLHRYDMRLKPEDAANAPSPD
ncbi:MAG: GNAT family N-acetyltransferase [Trueperaceae bacterium]|nr:GNAT family N-acetyltransferase [Trueperaceae bacterium]